MPPEDTMQRSYGSLASDHQVFYSTNSALFSCMKFGHLVFECQCVTHHTVRGFRLMGFAAGTHGTFGWI